mgnify:CR=1 FL=1
MLISYTIKSSGRFLTLDLSFIVPVALSNSSLPKMYFLVDFPPTNFSYSFGLELFKDCKLMIELLIYEINFGLEIKRLFNFFILQKSYFTFLKSPI